ncbi:MAG: ribosome hibernation-promoting factor, HPF/YfiA family [Thermomicrobiales bacterium]
MDPQIRGNDFQVSDSLRDFASRRLQKLDRRIDRIVDAKLELKKRRHRSGGDLVTAQLTIQTGRHLLRAEEHDHDPRKAIDAVVDTMDRQIRKFHDRRTDRKGRLPTAVAVNGLVEPMPVDLEPDPEDEPESPIVRTKRFSMKPMDAEEAIEQMELLGHDFFLFHNSEESQLNVVYRRRDGTFGLLAPDLA